MSSGLMLPAPPRPCETSADMMVEFELSSLWMEMGPMVWEDKNQAREVDTYIGGDGLIPFTAHPLDL